MKQVLADLKLAARHLLDLSKLYVRNANNEIAYYNLLFAVAIATRPRLVLELGTGPGVSSLAFIRALQYGNSIGRVNNGRLHSCDVNVEALRRFGHFQPLVVPHHMSTDCLAERWDKPIDLLYIDADHSHEQSLADFEHFFPWVVPNGIILMHDTHPLTPEHEDLQFSGTVWKTVQVIKQKYSADCEIMTFPHLCGVSFFRKKGSKYF